MLAREGQILSGSPIDSRGGVQAAAPCGKLLRGSPLSDTETRSYQHTTLQLCVFGLLGMKLAAHREAE
jgi:hypothetical protein